MQLHENKDTEIRIHEATNNDPFEYEQNVPKAFTELVKKQEKQQSNLF